MFDRNAALAQAAQLLPPSIVATPVAIVSADPKTRSALRTRLTKARDVQIVDERERARVLIWDARELEDDGGLPLLPVEAAAGAELPAIVALLGEEVDPMPLLAAGVRSVLSRDVGSERLRAAVLAAELGLVVLGEDAGDGVVAGWSPEELPAPAPIGGEGDPLTPREREVLTQLAEGLSNRAIAERLGISAHTVKFHVDALLDKLDARSRTQAVVEAIRRGLLELA